MKSLIKFKSGQVKICQMPEWTKHATNIATCHPADILNMVLVKYSHTKLNTLIFIEVENESKGLSKDKPS